MSCYSKVLPLNWASSAGLQAGCSSGSSPETPILPLPGLQLTAICICNSSTNKAVVLQKEKMFNSLLSWENCYRVTISDNLNL